ncbi:MAG: UbiD family decarboxylase, partial [Planctomycetota bacterium]
MIKNLRQFLEVLRREGELVEVDASVDPHLEIAEVHRRVIAAGGPALLFRHPKGAGMPVVTNLFGTRRRVELAFGNGPQVFIERLVHLAETLVPPSLSKLWQARGIGWQFLRLGLGRRRSGPVNEVVDRNPNLKELPIITCWSGDGGPFITLGLVYTEHPVDRRHNLGIYRMQRHDERRLGMHWQIGKGGGFHYHAAEEQGEPLPVTVLLGGPPALMVSALAPLPENVGELLLASLLMGGRLPRVHSSVSPHPIVAETELALVGHVSPGERFPEGPFGDHYGYYSLRHDYPVFHLETLLRRSDAIYPATVVGKPRQEDFYLGDFLQELLSPLFPLVMPAVRDLWSYGETGYHSLAAAKVRDRYPREAMMSAFRILGEGQLSLTKFLLVTDGDVNLRDFRALLEHILARVEWERDLFIFSCISMDTLDYNGPQVNEGSKGVLLGMGEAQRDLPAEFQGTLPVG